MQIIKNITSTDKHIVQKQHGNTEALLVLVGLGNLFVDWHILGNGFKQLENLDIYIPDYIARESMSKSVEKLDNFITDHQLQKYKKVHLFAYILGGRIINQYLASYSLPNLASIVYDRSPIQELAPIIITQQHPQLARLIFGNIIHEVAQASYQACPIEHIPIGLMIESEATPIMRFFKKQAQALLPLDWSGDAFQQAYDDLIYVPLNHNEMYWKFDSFIDEVKKFLSDSTFTENAPRIAPTHSRDY